MKINWIPVGCARADDCEQHADQQLLARERRRESSERLLDANGWPIVYCHGGGHRMHWDEGREHFWQIVILALQQKEAAIYARTGVLQADTTSLPGC